MQGTPQTAALRTVLNRQKDLSEDVFYYGDRLRPVLLRLLHDAEVGESAAGLLALIAMPEDIRAIIESPRQPKKMVFANRWAYGVTTSLLHPTSEEEWSFLRRCALNELTDRWVDQGAIQSLKLIASPRGQTILEEAQRKNPYRARSVARALEYVVSGPRSLSSSNLQSLAEQVAETIGTGEWRGNSPARCNEMGNKALVDFSFEAGLDRLTYTATFHRTEATWTLRGVRQTMQALIMRPISKK